MSKSDIIIYIITENSLSSTMIFYDLALKVSDKKTELSIVVGNVFPPKYILRANILRVKDKENINSEVLQFLSNQHVGKKDKNLKISQKIENNLDEKIILLQSALTDNQLTLVCGAGVSKASNMPDWNQLLVNILNEIYLNDRDSNTKAKVSGLLFKKWTQKWSKVSD